VGFSQGYQNHQSLLIIAVRGALLPGPFYNRMKSPLIFIISSIIFGKVFATEWKAIKNPQGNCITWKASTPGPTYQSWYQGGTQMGGPNEWGMFTCTGDGTSQNYGMIQSITLQNYYWDPAQAQWMSTIDVSGCLGTQTSYENNVAPFVQGLPIPINGGDPNTWWPDGPQDLETCSDPAIDCEEYEGQTREAFFVKSEYLSATDYCSDGCEVNITGVGVELTTTLILDKVQYTGQPSVPGCAPAIEDPQALETCSEAQAYCDKACAGIEQNFQCDEATGVFACNCEYPPYRRQYDPDTDEMKTDSDGDGLTNDDPAETDMDNDGTPDDQDSDPDGDGHTTQDKDSDNDGTNNRGQFTYGDQNADWGSHNGLGTDDDLDGDGIPNHQDNDMDGDGISNLSDPDMDGDGVYNSSDLDQNANGIIDGNETDPDMDGQTGSDDPDPYGEDVSTGDTETISQQMRLNKRKWKEK
jgi:hypothetical protein